MRRSAWHSTGPRRARLDEGQAGTARLNAREEILTQTVPYRARILCHGRTISPRAFWSTIPVWRLCWLFERSIFKSNVDGFLWESNVKETSKHVPVMMPSIGTLVLTTTDFTATQLPQKIRDTPPLFKIKEIYNFRWEQINCINLLCKFQIFLYLNLFIYFKFSKKIKAPRQNDCYY